MLRGSGGSEKRVGEALCRSQWGRRALESLRRAESIKPLPFQALVKQLKFNELIPLAKLRNLFTSWGCCNWVASMTEAYRLTALEARSWKSQCCQGPSWDHEGESGPWLSSGFRWPQASLVSSAILLLCPSVSVSRFSPYRSSPAMWTRAYP